MQPIKQAHLIGVGGVNMSAVAKTLQRAGVAVSGSDACASEFTDELAKQGVKIFIGHAATQVPPGTNLVIYSSAVPEHNPERAEARKRELTQLTNFEFWGRWAEERETLVVTGTHGKSTTTAMLGLMLEQTPLRPQVVVGTRVPGFADGNVFFGSDASLLIEGDEYARHFLAFHPQAVILNNIELDHTDVFPDLEALRAAFRELLQQVQAGGVVVANADDPQVSTLIGQTRAALEARGIRIFTFGFGSHADTRIADYLARPGEQTFSLRDDTGVWARCTLRIPGRMNAMNAAAAASLAHIYQTPPSVIQHVLSGFRGVWRRFEIVAEEGKTTVVSDYAHHPTAVRATLEAARQWYPGRRLVACFQPHHRNRLKHLFLDFVSCFDAADLLFMCEVYDVKGREHRDDQALSSQDLLEAIRHHDADRGARRWIEYAPDPAAALEALRRARQPGDVIMVMGAGDIYQIVGRILEPDQVQAKTKPPSL